MTREKQIYKTTLVGSAGNLALVVFKFIAGVLGHSSAMIADAVHSVSDFLTDLIVMLFVKISSKPRDHEHQYGHGKYETLATAIIGLILMGVGFGIFWNGAKDIWRFMHGEALEAPGWLAFIAAIVSILVKEGLFHYTMHVGRKLQSQAVIANAWHHRSDAFSSIATALGIAGAILLGAKGRVLDPIAAVIVSVLIIKVAIDTFVPSINELLEKSLPDEMEAKIMKVLQSFPEVTDPHNLRTRRIGPICSMDIHVRMDGNLTVKASHDVTLRLEDALHQVLGPESIINIHVEPIKEKNSIFSQK